MNKVFYKDIINWCVIESELIGDGIVNQLEINDYTLKEYKETLKNRLIMIVCPDRPSLIAIKYAVKHSKLSDRLKSIIKYQIDNRFPYVVCFEPFNTTLDDEVDYVLKKFLKDKPWNDSQERGFECFYIRKPVQVAKVVAYNSYLKKNNIMILKRHKLTDSSGYYYVFKGINGSPELSFSMDQDDQKALDHCLDFLKYRTCLRPVTVTKYEFKVKGDHIGS